MRPLPLWPVVFALFAAVPCRAQNDTARAQLEALGGAATPAPQDEHGKTVVVPIEPPTAKEFGKALRWGAINVVAHQWQDGSWGENNHQLFGQRNTLYTRNAITAIVLGALERMPRKNSDLSQALQHGRDYLLKNGLPPADSPRNEINDKPYSLAFGLTWLLRHPELGDQKQRVQLYLKEIDALASGNLSYSEEDKVVATFQVALLALAVDDARALGHAVPKDLLERLGAKDFAGAYAHCGYYVNRREDEHAAAPREALCLLAAERSGAEVDQARLEKAVETFLRDLAGLKEVVDSGRGAHDYKRHAWAPYMYIFGIYWTTQAAKRLPKAKAHDAAAILARTLIDEQENAGAWQDSAYFSGRSYDTAYAMCALMDQAEILGVKPDFK